MVLSRARGLAGMRAQAPREPPVDILRRERSGETELGKAFREEEGLSASGRRKPGGRGWGGHLGKAATAISSDFPSQVVGAVKATACWSLRTSSSPGAQSSPPQETFPRCQQHPHQLLEAPSRSLPGNGSLLSGLRQTIHLPREPQAPTVFLCGFPPSILAAGDRWRSGRSN